MTCDDVRIELSARMDDAGDPGLDDDVDAHLATCAACRRFRDGALRLRERTRREAAVPVPDLVAPIMDAVRTRGRRRPGPRVVVPALAGAAAVLLAVIAVLSMRGGPVPASRVEAMRVLRTRTVLVWSPGEVGAGLTDAVERLPGVAEVARVRSGVVWLDRWTDSEGRVHRPPSGLRVPIEVAGIEPDHYERLVPPGDMDVLAELRDGRVVLGDGGAALRGIAGEGSLDIAGHRLAVAGIVDDALIGAHEAVVSSDVAQQLSIERVRYLLVAIDDGADIDTVIRGVRASVTGDDLIRIRTLGESPYLRHGDAVLPQVRMKQLFGEFAAAETSDGNLRVDPSWTERNIVTATVPVLGSVRCHRLVMPQLRAATDDLEREGLAALIRPDDFGGCFFPRYLSQDPDAGISHHSWGVAFDVNVGSNAFGKPPQLDPRIVEVIERHGFTWGGRWLVPDGMHFEYVRSVRPDG
jgi:hypothetical protein